MGRKYTVDELDKCSKQELMLMVLAMQEQMERMNENLENLIEQIRAANLERFGCHTEKMSELDGQLSFFNEAEYYLDDAGEPELEEFLPQKDERLTLRIFRKKCMSMMSQKNSSMRYSVKETGVKCWQRNTSVSVMSLRHGQLKIIKCMYMWVRMAAIRMNSFVGTVPRIFCATASIHRLWVPLS